MVGLGRYAERRGGELAYGDQRRLELVRALATRPRLLMLDEPAAGLSHGEVDELMELVRQLRDRYDLTVVLVEHHMGLVMRLCDRITVLNFGRTIAAGTPARSSSSSTAIVPG